MSMYFKGDKVAPTINVDTGKYRGLLNGTLDSFSNLIAKTTTLKPYRFQNFTALTKADFTGITTIPDYTCQNCTNLEDLVLDEDTTSIGQYAFSSCSKIANEITFKDCEIGYQSFYGTKITAVKGTTKNINGQAFYNNSNLKTVDLKVNGSIGDYNFYNSNITSLNIDKDSVITSLGSYAFRSVGSNRTTPESNVFTLDFRNSTFTSLGSSCFQSTKYMDIYFPSTLKTISNSSQFASSQYLNIYYKNVPTLGGTGVFSSVSNVKNFFPYELLKTATTSTNWVSSSILSTIFGYAPANTFNAGETLPENDSQGWSLTWYSDSNMTTEVTTVSDASAIYYCSVGERVAVAVSQITTYQASCTVTDENGKTYSQGDTVKTNTVLTITAQGGTDTPKLYQLTLNGTALVDDQQQTSATSKYTVGEDNIAIICIGWDGVNTPVNPSFADNTPAQIKVGIDTGVGKTLWTIGDKKSVTLTNGNTYNLVLLDLTENRYEKSDGSGYSNGVLGFEEIIQNAQINSSPTNAGGWAESKMYKETMSQILAILPQEWQDVISTVKVASTVGSTSTSVSYSDNTVFLPARVEVFDPVTDSGYKDEGTVFDYYKNSGSGSGNIRIKKYNGSVSRWWLRSPFLYNSNSFMFVNTNGDWNVSSASDSYGVSVCFAI